MEVALIVARATNGVIGKDNQLAWHLPNDLKFFKNTTIDAPIIMGRKTYESIGKPLPRRTNIVVSRNTQPAIDGCFRVTSIQEALDMAKASKAKICYIIGGAELYKQSLPLVNKLIITEVHAVLEGNVLFDFNPKEWIETARENHYKDEKHAYDYSFVTYERA